MASVTGVTCFKTRKAAMAFLADEGYALNRKYGIWERTNGHEVMFGYTEHCGHHVTVERF